MKKLIFGLVLANLTTIGIASEFDVELVKKFSRGQSVMTNIEQLSELGLDDFSLKHTPWTSSYLPAIRGYAADPFPTSGSNVLSVNRNIKKFEKSTKKYNEGKIQLDSETIANLSTSDKYDLLVGNFRTEDSLSTNLFSQAKFLKDRFGKITFWTGMCHGWAPAAIAHNAPKKTVYVTSVDGKYRIPFYPNDIKSLLSVAFANSTKVFADDENGNLTDYRISTNGNPDSWSSAYVMPIHGFACRDKKVKVDEEGRAIVPEDADESNCEDVNAGFWHVTVVNLMGRHQQGLVVDIDHNETVNNHPTEGYKLTYFNPLTGKAGSLDESRVNVDDFPEDLRLKHRSSKAREIVGVEMNMNFLNYKFFNKKNAKLSDIQEYKERVFLYDLELDENGNIIGGEWKSKKRNKVKRNLFGTRKPGEKPDFLWYAPKGIKAFANQEWMVQGQWEKGDPLPQSWADAAVAAAKEKNLDYSAETDENGFYPFKKQPEVVFSIVNRLLELSQ